MDGAIGAGDTDGFFKQAGAVRLVRRPLSAVVVHRLNETGQVFRTAGPRPAGTTIPEPQIPLNTAILQPLGEKR